MRDGLQRLSVGLKRFTAAWSDGARAWIREGVRLSDPVGVPFGTSAIVVISVENAFYWVEWLGQIQCFDRLEGFDRIFLEI